MTEQAAPMPAASDDDAMPTDRAIDQFDLEIVAFVSCWAPYGGPPEDECVPRFGMPLDRLLKRFCAIVRYGRRGHLKPDELALLGRAAALCVVDEVEAQGHRVDRPSPSILRPFLRQGVWRWA